MKEHKSFCALKTLQTVRVCTCQPKEKKCCKKCKCLTGHCVKCHAWSSCPCHQPPAEESPSELAMKVTELVLNKEPYWSKKLEEILNEALSAERKKVIEIVEGMKSNPGVLKKKGLYGECYDLGFKHAKQDAIRLINLLKN